MPTGASGDLLQPARMAIAIIGESEIEHEGKIYHAVLKSGCHRWQDFRCRRWWLHDFYAPYNNKFAVIETLNKLGGRVMRYNFTEHGLTTWTI